MMRKSRQAPEVSPIYHRIRQILESARTNVARSVNTTQVVANWLIGREIVEEEQRGSRRAGYGEDLLAELSANLRRDFGTGYSVDNLELFRRFYLEYSALLPANKSEAVRRISLSQGKSDALRRKLGIAQTLEDQSILHALRGKSSRVILHAPRAELNAETISDALSRENASDDPSIIGHALRGESWVPRQLHPSFSWTRFCALLCIGNPEARAH